MNVISSFFRLKNKCSILDENKLPCKCFMISDVVYKGTEKGYGYLKTNI